MLLSLFQLQRRLKHGEVTLSSCRTDSQTQAVWLQGLSSKLLHIFALNSIKSLFFPTCLCHVSLTWSYFHWQDLFRLFSRQIILIIFCLWDRSSTVNLPKHGLCVFTFPLSKWLTTLSTWELNKWILWKRDNESFNLELSQKKIIFIFPLSRSCVGFQRVSNNVILKIINQTIIVIKNNWQAIIYNICSNYHIT